MATNSAVGVAGILRPLCARWEGGVSDIAALLAKMPPRPWRVRDLVPSQDLATIIQDANGKQVSVVLAPDFAELGVALVNAQAPAQMQAKPAE